MKTSTRPIVLGLALVAALWAPAARAQQPAQKQQPPPAAAAAPQEEEEVPSLGMDDVARPAPVVAAGPSEAIAALRGTPMAGLVPGFDELAARLERGESIDVAVRFDLGADGKPSNVRLERGTGLRSLDDAIVSGLSSPRTESQAFKEFADCRDFQFSLSVSKARIGAAFSAEAPSAARAAAIVQRAQGQMSLLALAAGSDPDLQQILRGITSGQTGTRFNMGITIDGELIERVAKKAQTK